MTEFVYLSETIRADQQDEADKKATDLVATTPDLQRLVDFEIDGFRIGRNVLSVVLRQFRVGCLDNGDERHRAAVTKMLGRSLAAKAFIERFLRERRIDIAIFNERGYTPAGEVFDGCLLRDVDTIQWCSAPQAGCLIYRRYSLDSRGDHPAGLSDNLWKRLLKLPRTSANDGKVAARITDNYVSGDWFKRQQLQEGKTIKTEEEVRRTLQLDSTKKTAVVFCHILYDATFFYGKNLFRRL